MKTVYTLAAVLALGGVLSDYGAARSVTRTSSMLAESSPPSTGGHDAALYAEAESNGPSAGGRDTAQFAEGESNGPSPRGQDSALA